MADTYSVGIFPGERAEKTVVRAFIYQRAIQCYGLTSFREDHHLVLGGAGGDIRLLLAAGVPPENIHVAELRLPVCRSLRAKFPQVRIHQEDALLLLARNWQVRFRTVNLDLCQKLSTATVTWLRACAHSVMSSEALLAVTLCGSRELEPEISKAIESLKRRGYASAHARCEVLYKLLRVNDPQLRLGPYVGYNSPTRTTAGAPHSLSMCTAMFYRGVSSYLTEPYYPFGSRIDQRELALDLRVSGLKAPAVATILNLPRQRVAGWFAVDTKRG